jgi:hypothetical protein
VFLSVNCQTPPAMTTVEITFDAKERGSFDQQHDAFVRELQKQGLVVSKAIRREDATRVQQGSETTIHLLEDGLTLQDAVTDIRRAASKCLHITLPNLARHLIVYGPQGQHLLELDIAPDETS